MFSLIPLLSERQLELDLLKNMKVRAIEQKHTYVGKGAQLYYQKVSAPNLFLGPALTDAEYYNFLSSNYLAENLEKFAFISLACGNASSEKKVLEQSFAADFPFVYLGVDSSKSMLELAYQELKPYDFKKFFIWADFMAPNFAPEMFYYLRDYPNRVFAFLGYTFGNMVATDIVDTLVSILKGGDVVWIDAVFREDTKKESDLLMFEHYTQRLQDPLQVNHFFYSLQEAGVDIKKGEPKLEMVIEHSIGALAFRYYFLCKEKINVTVHSQKVTLLPNERLEVLNIRAYHEETFIHFFEEHGFEVVSSMRKGKWGQFLFRLK